MSIEVSGGGSIAVETESMLRTQRALARLALHADDVHDEVDGALEAAHRLPGGGVRLLMLLTRARAELVDARATARELAAELEAAAAAYGFVEQVLLAEQLMLARVVGPPFALVDAALSAAGAVVRDHTLDLASAGLVSALRALADSLDLPVLLQFAQALPGRALEETPVTAVQITGASVPRAARAPGGFADLADRIPPGRKGEPQVRVERYELSGDEVHWIVYSAGTIDWSLDPDDEPWDDTSNVVGVAGGSAGSTRAAIEALKQAGWRPGDPVVPVGHSQGGMVATAMVAGGAVSAPLLVTFGSPTAGVRLPQQTIDVAVEHTDDPVPALGGSPRPFDGSRLVVREPAPGTAGQPGVAAHSMTGYRETAAELDSSTDPRVAHVRSALAEFTGGRTAEVTLWRGERVRAASVNTPVVWSSEGGR